jgi:hypothetical protein
MKMTVEFDHLTKAQAVAIEEYFAVWKALSEKNVSMWTAFFCDSEGNFMPSIKVNGKDPQRFMKDIGLRLGKVKFVTENGDLPEDMYFIDFERVDKALENDQD